MKRVVFNVVKVLVGILLLYAALKGFAWREISIQSDRVSFLWLGGALLTLLASSGIKVLRWIFLLRKLGLRYSGLELAEAFFVGQSSNILLPFRGGDVVRIAWTVRSQPGDVLKVSSSILLEKYLDLVLMFLALGIVMLTKPIEIIGLELSRLAMPVTIFTVLIVVGVWTSRYWVKPIVNLRKLAKRKILQNLLDVVLGFLHAVSEISTISTWAGVFGITGICWLVMTLTNVLVFKAVQLEPDFWGGLLVLVFVYIGLLPGLMPGNVGPFYFFSGLALAAFDTPPDIRLLYGILLHLVVTVPPLVLGSFFLIIHRWYKA